MATFNEYKTKTGQKLYSFRLDAGVDKVTGQRIRLRRSGFRTKKEAQLAMARLQTHIDQEGLHENKLVTFSDAYKLWFEQYRHTVKESTEATTKRLITDHILPYFGKVDLAKLKPAYCQKIINQWFNDGLKSYIKYKNYASKIIDYMISLDEMKRNPFDNIIIPKRRYTEQAKVKYFYSKPELTRLFKGLEDMDDLKPFMFFWLLTYTGMRKGEAIALQWSDIDFENGTISIQRTMTRGENNRVIVLTPKTATSKRVIDIDPQTIKYLKKWHLAQSKSLMFWGVPVNKDHQLVFTSRVGKMITDSKPRVWLRAVLDHINKNVAFGDELKPIRVHGFRHTHASLLFQAGVDIKDVSERLGHRNIQTTLDVYTHVTEKQKKDTATKFQQFMEL